MSRLPQAPAEQAPSALLYDGRPHLQGQPGLHAFLAGVSLYPHLPGGGGRPAPNHFGMEQLTAAALTAYQLSQWLVNNQAQLPVPLATCRVLLSPSPAETAVEPALAGTAGCRWDDFAQAVRDWRQDALAHAGGYTLFYFAGHGVQRSRTDSVMLLQDFGDGIGGSLTRGAGVNNLFAALAPTGPKLKPPVGIARTQFYFIDACRVLPSKFKDRELMSVPDVLDAPLNGVDDRTAPIYYAAAPGAAAYSLAGQGTLFGTALLACLAGGAGKAMDKGDGVRWYVTSHSLDAGLNRYLEVLNRNHGSDQDCVMGGLAGEATLVRTGSPPAVEVELKVDDAGALPCTDVQVQELQSGVSAWPQLARPINPHPYHGRLPAGFYLVGARIVPPTPGYVDCKPTLREAVWPLQSWKVKVTA
jgi:hypothetical protein